MLNKPTRHITQTEKLLKLIEEHIKDKDININSKLNENNESECLFAQTDYMCDM